MCDLTFDALVQVIRSSQGISPHLPITEHFDLEKDLGITGDDGDVLLEAVAQRFSIPLQNTERALIDVLGLTEHEALFHSEGAGLFGFFVELWCGKPVGNVRTMTVGQRFDAVQRAANDAERC